MKQLMFTIVALLFSLTMSANSIEGTSNLPTNEFNNNKIEVVEELNMDCIVSVTRINYTLVLITEDFIYIESGSVTIVEVWCWE